MKLSPVAERYVLHWGEMGARWGVNRSISQIHALLYLAGRPMPADEIVETLGIARSNVSTSLRELQAWRLVGMTHVLGDRRDHFHAVDDLWAMLMTIVEERRKREIDPTLTMLRRCALDAEHDPELDPEAARRIRRMLEFIETLNTWYASVRRLPKPTLVALMKMGARVGKFVSTGSRKGAA